MKRRPARGRTAVVVGAGIGGLTAALALRRGGWRVTVLEREADPDEIGAGIQIAPNATRVLVGLGLRPALDPVAVTPLEQVRRRWRDGSVIATAPMGAAIERRYGAPYWQFHRGQLFRVLLDACLAGGEGRAVDLVTACEIVAVESSGSAAVAVAADGRGHAADLVVGADGLWSKVRAAAGFGGPLLREDELSYRALIPTAALAADPGTAWVTRRPQNTLWFGPGAHAVHFLVRAGEQLCLVVQRAGTDARLDTAPSLLVPAAEFVRTVPGWDERLLALLAHADDDVLLQPLLHREPDDEWVRGRIALLGDAAHAMLPYQGQGGSQAIEDAGVLAHALRSATGRHIDDALARYQRLRAPVAAAVQRASAANKRYMHLHDGPRQQERDARMREHFDGDGEITFDRLWRARPA